MSKSLNILRYVSDLHLELRPSVHHPKLVNLWEIKKQPGDKYYLALLGDIGNPYQKNLIDFLSLISPKYDRIFYIPGNHEYYNLGKNGASPLLKTKKEFEKKLEEICNQFNNISVLNNQVYQLDGIKIIGSTLWSQVSDENQKYISYAINDYRLIRKEKAENSVEEDSHLPCVTVSDTNQWNKESIDFINNEIMIATDPCIVLTHHAPLFSDAKSKHYTADPKYLDSPNDEAFHNNLLHLLKKPVVAWLYGHTHYASKFEINGVIVATNQLGYSNEEKSIKFNSYAFLDLKKIILDNAIECL